MNKLLKVLIVEDSEDDVQLLLRELNKGGYKPTHKRVQTAVAMKKALKEQWDIILSDYKMPNFSAPEALKVLQSTNLDIPFIIVSGSVGEDTAVETLKEGAQDFITKMNLSRLVPAIEREIRDWKIRQANKLAEKALEESEHRYKHLFQNHPNPMWVYDIATLKFVDVNEAAIDKYGYSREEFLSMTLFDIRPKKDYQRLKENLAKPRPILQHSGEWQHLLKNGKIIFVDINSYLFEDNGKKLSLVVVNDITERKNAEAALKKSEEQFRNLVENINDVFYVSDGQGRFIYCSPNFYTSMGYSLQEIIGKSYIRIVAPVDRRKVVDHYLEETKNGVLDTKLELRVRCKDGKIFWVEQNTRIVRDNNGTVAQYRNVVRDITERKRAEEQLKNQHSTLKGMIESTDSAIFSIDTAYRYTSFNSIHASIVKAIYGVDIEVGKNLLDYMKVEEDRQKAKRNLGKALNGESFTEEAFSGDESLSRLYFSVSHNPIRNADGNIIGVAVYSQNITERKRAVIALQNSEEQLRATLESTADGILAVDNNGKVVKTNRRFAELWHIPQSLIDSGDDNKLLNFVVDQLFEPESFIKKVQSLYGSSETDIDTLNFKDGRVFERYSSPMFVENSIIGRVWSFRDITERKQAEQALRASESKFRAVSDTSAAAIFIYQGEKFVYWNPASLSITGYSDSDFKELRFWDIIHPDFKDMMKERGLARQRGEQVPSRYEFKLVTKTGDVLWLDYAAGVIQFEGKPAALGVAFDITERKKAEEQLKISEQTLRESEERYRSLFDRMMDGVYRSTHEGRFVDVNPTMVKMFGFASKEEMLNADIKKDLYFAPSERDSLFMDTGQERTEIFRMRHKDGSEIWVEDHGSYVHDEKGNVIFHEGILRDVTARLLAEDTLRKSEEKYKDIFTWAPVGIYQSSIDGKIVTANKSLADMLGYDVAEDLINRDMAKDVYYNEEERHKLIKEYDTKGQGSVTNLEILWKKKDGSSVWVMLTAHAIKDKSGKTIYYEGFVYDITEQKRAEENIRMLSRAMEQSPASVVITDLDGKIEYVNPKFTQVTGYTSAEALGQNPRVLKSGETPDKEYKQLWETITSGKEWRGEFHNKKKNGEFYWEYASISPIKDVSGKTTHYLAVKEDITEKKTLEQQFFRTQRLESIGTLAGGIAHDLNNVLAPILLSVELLNRRHSDEATKKLLSSMESSALRGRDIIKQVLTFARGIEGQHVSIDLRHIVKEIDNIIMETFPKNIKKVVDIPKDLLTIVGDATQIHQVLLNLCINARDAMPHGGTLSITASNIRIDTQYARMNLNARQGTYVLLNVTDTGTGIPPEILVKIFEPFFTTKEIGKGTGLGLSTVYTIIKNHGGFIEVQSELGKGTTFKVHFPVVESAEAQQIQKEHAHPVGGNGELILVVDDEASVLEVTKQTLAMYGYNILSASDGTDAVALYAQHKDEIDLVVSDILMPTLDGVMMARTLLRMNPYVKIILTSGHKIDEPPSSQDDLKIEAFLQKPYTAEYLLKIVHDVLSRGK